MATIKTDRNTSSIVSHFQTVVMRQYIQFSRSPCGNYVPGRTVLKEDLPPVNCIVARMTITWVPSLVVSNDEFH